MKRFHLLLSILALTTSPALALRCLPTVTLIQAGKPLSVPGPYGPLPVVVRTGQVYVPLLWVASFYNDVMNDVRFNVLRLDDHLFQLGRKEMHDLAPMSWSGITATFVHPLRAAPTLIAGRIYLPLEGLSEVQEAAVGTVAGTLKIIPKPAQSCPARRYPSPNAALKSSTNT